MTGIGAQICGDAHAANFGLYGDARGKLVIDLNDFDETLYGPWEWDVKRLATSMVLAGREAGAGEDDCRRAAQDVAGAYRRTMRLLAKMPVIEAWNAIADEALVSHADAKDLVGTLELVAEKARKNTSARFAAKATERTEDGGRRFVDAPPVLRRVPDAEAAAVAASLTGYLETLPEDRLPLLARHAVHDVAFRVVGTGSVGLRSYVVLLLDHRGEPVVLQVKEARASVLASFVARAGFPVPAVVHEGRRVVLGQRRMQVVSDILLGWTTVQDAASLGGGAAVTQRPAGGLALPGPSVQKPQGQRGPGAALRRSDGRLCPHDRCSPGPRPCAQRRPAPAGRVLRQERGAGRGNRAIRGRLRGPYGSGPCGAGHSGEERADRGGDGGVRGRRVAGPPTRQETRECRGGPGPAWAVR